MIAWAAIRSLLGRVPVVAWVIVAALAWGGWQRHQARAEHAGRLKAVQELADIRLAAAQNTSRIVVQAMANQQETLHDAELATANEERARGAVTVSLGRLLSGVRSAERARANPPAGAGSAPAQPGPSVCPDVLGRVGEAAGRIAAEAGRYRIAGAKCEADYDAAQRLLTTKP